MPEWDIFPFENPRTEKYKEYGDKDILERIVASQVAFLLSKYGELYVEEVDNSDGTEFDGSMSYKGIRIERIPLEDDGEIEISQFPLINGEFSTQPGHHSVTKFNEDDVSEFMVGIGDPEKPGIPKVTDSSKNSVDGKQLLELHDALDEVEAQFKLMSKTVNDPFIETTVYPVRVNDELIDWFDSQLM